MRRGEVYQANLDPTEGSEQSGRRPVIIVGRDAINNHSPVVIGVPCTTYSGQKVYNSQILIYPPEGGLTAPTVALGEQITALSKTRFERLRGTLSPATMAKLEQALIIALDLPDHS